MTPLENRHMGLLPILLSRVVQKIERGDHKFLYLLALA
jgi:hypothetical protein